MMLLRQLLRLLRPRRAARWRRVERVLEGARMLGRSAGSYRVSAGAGIGACACACSRRFDAVALALAHAHSFALALAFAASTIQVTGCIAVIGAKAGGFAVAAAVRGLGRRLGLAASRRAVAARLVLVTVAAVAALALGIAPTLALVAAGVSPPILLVVVSPAARRSNVASARALARPLVRPLACAAACAVAARIDASV